MKQALELLETYPISGAITLKAAGFALLLLIANAPAILDGAVALVSGIGKLVVLG